MADDSTRVNAAGATETIAADDIGGVKYQRVKLNVGADGVSVDVEPPDADGKAASKMPAVGPMVWNGASWDRAVGGGFGDGMAATGLPFVGPRLWNGATYDRWRSIGTVDGQGPNGYGAVGPQLFNETTYDRARGNTTGTLLASAARTATTVAATQTNYNARGCHVVLKVTAASGTGGLKIAWLGVAPTGSTPYSISQATTGILTTGTFAYELYPGAGAATAGMNLVERFSGALPRAWYVQVTAGDASSYTYSLDYALIL